MKKLIKSLLPTSLLKSIRPIFHGLKAEFYATINGHPAKKLKVIGITGTKGKTSTTVLMGRLMNDLGYKTGFASTALLYDGKNEKINSTKMTSIDAKLLQSMLKNMVANGCKYVVLEMSSQGLEQNRHKGIGGFDMALFLNLYKEHVEAHGSFEKYRDAKGLLFKNLRHGSQVLTIDKAEFLKDMEYYYNNNFIPKDATVTKMNSSVYQVINAQNSQFQKLSIYDHIYDTNLVADFEVENLAFAIKATELITKDKNLVSKIIPVIANIKTIPGRLEYVVKANHNLLSNKTSTDAQSLPVVDIIVDYAHETGSMERLLKNLSSWKAKGYYDYLIHVVSCDGVGRDDWKKPILGDLSQKFADYSLVTTDNYEAIDNPQAIIDMICANFDHQLDGKTYSKVVNRKQAMIAALKQAQKQTGKKVLIVSTGVGAEQQLTQPEGMLDWDERLIWSMVFDEIYA
jgi:UDP-N-acetylmuramoyl-L-alanyl-D-glutamate--2,6-diaminopimelate ligase